MRGTRSFLLVGALAFGAASLVHKGVLLEGYEHYQAGIAEGVIGLVLAFGWVVSLVSPGLTRIAGLTTQAFALLGTCVGITMIAIGVGPQTAFDVALHAAFVTLLVTGLTRTARRRAA